MIIIGITGTIGAGKGTIVELLIKKGFKHYSVRDFLVEEIKKRGLEINRDTMTATANSLREEFGNDYIVKTILNTAIANGDDCVIESIRNDKEIELLRNIHNFYLFSVDADIKTRYQRICLRKSATDNVSFETFVENEKREMQSDNNNSQNIAICMQKADYTFINDQDIVSLLRTRLVYWIVIIVAASW